MQHWVATRLASLPRAGFDLADPVPAADGRWVVDGWSATRHVDGRTADVTHDWAAVLGVARALHRATVGVTCPTFLATRGDPWARADRAAWGEERLAVPPVFAGLVDRLRSRLGDPGGVGDPQLVHGDLTTNVVLGPGSPTVIDVSPFWRPSAYADGIVVADAVTWFGAPATLALEHGVPREAVARGLLFRVLTSGLQAARGADGTLVAVEVERYTHALDAVGL